MAARDTSRYFARDSITKMCHPAAILGNHPLSPSAPLLSVGKAPGNFHIVGYI